VHDEPRPLISKYTRPIIMAHHLTYLAVLAKPPTGDPRCPTLLLPILILLALILPWGRIAAAASRNPKRSPRLKP
jgi:hypothetical protein